jgi:hypothetical protein
MVLRVLQTGANNVPMYQRWDDRIHLSVEEARGKLFESGDSTGGRLNACRCPRIAAPLSAALLGLKTELHA